MFLRRRRRSSELGVSSGLNDSERESDGSDVNQMEFHIRESDRFHRQVSVKNVYFWGP